MEINKGTTNGVKKKHRQSFCLKCSLWILASFGLALGVFLMVFTVWTFVSYQNSVKDLRTRVEQVETEFQTFKDRIDDYIFEKVDSVVQEVMILAILTHESVNWS